MSAEVELRGTALVGHKGPTHVCCSCGYCATAPNGTIAFLAAEAHERDSGRRPSQVSDCRARVYAGALCPRRRLELQRQAEAVARLLADAQKSRQ